MRDLGAAPVLAGYGLSFMSGPLLKAVWSTGLLMQVLRNGLGASSEAWDWDCICITAHRMLNGLRHTTCHTSRSPPPVNPVPVDTLVDGSTLEVNDAGSALAAMAMSLVAKASYTVSEEGEELVSPSVMDKPITPVLALKAV